MHGLRKLCVLEKNFSVIYTRKFICIFLFICLYCTIHFIARENHCIDGFIKISYQSLLFVFLSAAELAYTLGTRILKRSLSSKSFMRRRASDTSLSISKLVTFLSLLAILRLLINAYFLASVYFSGITILKYLHFHIE